MGNLYTANFKHELLNDSKQLSVGNEQDYHFKVLFLILKKLGFSLSKFYYYLFDLLW